MLAGLGLHAAPLQLGRRAATAAKSGDANAHCDFWDKTRISDALALPGGHAQRRKGCEKPPAGKRDPSQARRTAVSGGRALS
jgi:hypothetical protein